MARWQFCNVLHTGPESRRLWQFNASGAKFNLLREETKLPTEALSRKLIAKDWEALVQPRLNVAWLAPEKVFVRVIQLPKGEPDEIQSMLDLQMEKLSPLPTAQIVWSYEILEQPAGEMLTAIVVIVARHVVEEFLGQLEAGGFLADRLEVPLLDQLRATRVETDGAWIYPGLGTDKNSCMVAWWYGGVLRHLALVPIPAGERRGALLQEQLTQMAWAGEVDGWLTGPPKYHLVAAPETLAEWNLPFSADDTVVPMPAPELAALTARRAVAANGSVGLLPPEFAQRYRQQFVDRLWMRGIGALILAYLFIAGIYIALVQVAEWRYDNLQQELRSAALSYTNTIQIKEQVRVLQDQIDLQWAALDCYKAVAENLPEGLVVDTISFDGGRKLTLAGTGASAEDRNKVLDFVDALRKSSARDQLLFRQVDAQRITLQQGGAGLTWTVSADLRRTDVP